MLQFRSKLVADLAWVISSPALLQPKAKNIEWWDDDFFVSEYRTLLGWLRELDDNPIELERAIEKTKSHRLGHYFEELVAFWLDHSPTFDIVERNLQLIHEKTTLGEIDFILRDSKTDELIHLEVALKFYLRDGSSETMAQWIGPNRSDSLEKKVRKLVDHQLKISENHPERIAHSIKRHACLLKGVLFYPSNDISPPDFASKNHLRGIWRHKNASDKTRFGVLEKRDWMQAHRCIELRPFETGEKSVYAQSLSIEERPNRIMLVNDDWLGSGRQK